MSKTKVGIIGCGNISSIYIKNCSQMFDNLDVVACADILPERAQAKAQEFNIPKACSVEELLSDPAIEVAINLTIPKVHGELSMAALKAGKNVYVEKPLAISREDGKKVLQTAREKGLRVGCAPDTFLGSGLQTCRKMIDDGWIGEPVAATAFMMGHGPEGWHPDPEFFYQVGAGPLFDMGPYYLTALVSLLGPVKSVAGSARISFPERTVKSEPKYGTKIKVETPTHIAALLNFENGPVGTLITSFDVWGSNLPRIEIYGSEGTLSVPDPNTFGGPVLIKRYNSTEWKEVPLLGCFAENSRGLGVSDMSRAIVNGGKHKASGELAYHILDIMHGILDASREGKCLALESRCERPEPLGSGFTI